MSSRVQKQCAFTEHRFLTHQLINFDHVHFVLSLHAGIGKITPKPPFVQSKRPD
jgi:hypothetical protein